MYRISDRKEDMQLDRIMELLSKTYWAGSRPEEKIIASMERSLCFGAFDEKGRQIGFARVITDYTTTYYICDVIVDAAYRGHGIGKAMIDAINNYKDFRQMLGMLLTADAQAFYEKSGFLRGGARYMERRPAE